MKKKNSKKGERGKKLYQEMQAMMIWKNHKAHRQVHKQKYNFLYRWGATEEERWNNSFWKGKKTSIDRNFHAPYL